MVDIVAAEVRSRMMSGIRSKNTKPELILRQGLHAVGFRFRLHDRSLPGKPDIVFPRYRAVIMAHGCFWHGHDCHLFKMPTTRPDFWRAKIDRNRKIDARTRTALAQAGWRQAEVWECALKGKTRLPHDKVIDTCGQWLQSDAAELEIRGK
ncbi:very short patch repair endonuclease [Novosphingobium aquimarinum]|uniref:very short patch repair endonuclease n=1 Tax=Novosphingobium aquimarinum TaxID=2682494 RepID=UPI0012EB178E|nr:very short patch repair endonuclease [Novosphingobium aquimarinum]